MEAGGEDLEEGDEEWRRLHGSDGLDGRQERARGGGHRVEGAELVMEPVNTTVVVRSRTPRRSCGWWTCSRSTTTSRTSTTTWSSPTRSRPRSTSRRRRCRAPQRKAPSCGALRAVASPRATLNICSIRRARAEGGVRDHPGHRPRSREHRWGVVEVDGSRFRCVAYGCIDDARRDDRRRAPGSRPRRRRGVIARVRPDEAAVENVYFGTNAKTALATGQARGVALLATVEARARASGSTARARSSSAVVGQRLGRQAQVQYMVRAILGLDHEPKPDHAADALAVAHLPREPPASLARARGSVPSGRGRRGAAMIAFLTGRVAGKAADHALLEVGGVGFRLAMSTPRSRPCPPRATRSPSTPICTSARTSCRSSASSPPRSGTLFERLITVSGRGPEGRARGALVALARRPREALRARGRRAAVSVCRASGRRPRSGSSRAQGQARPARPGRGRGAAPARVPSPEATRCAAVDGLLARPRWRPRCMGFDGRRRRAGAAAHGAPAARRWRDEHGLGSRLAADGRCGTDERAPGLGATTPTDDLEIDRSLRPEAPRRVPRPGAGQGEPRACSSRPRAARNEPLDHVLLSGPPGSGQDDARAASSPTSSACPMKTTSGPAIERAGDLAAILTNLEERDVLFIDEIHRLNRVVEEVLYPAMEDFTLDVVIGKGPAARSLRLDVPALHARRRDDADRAAHRAAARPLRHGVPARLLHRRGPRGDRRALGGHPRRDDRRRGRGRDRAALARGTPRLANRLLKRVRDYAQVRRDGRITRTSRPRRSRSSRSTTSGSTRWTSSILETLASEVLGQAGRAQHARGRGRRGAGHARGRLRAVPAAARAH